MTDKSIAPIRNLVALLLFYLIVSLFYALWMTGGTGRFSECTIWPNYNLLARAFAKGQVHLDTKTDEDYVLVNGKIYLYSGPVPALLRLPVLALVKKEVPTGLMIVLFCAGVSLVSVMTLDVLRRSHDGASGSLLLVLFALLGVLNGFSLFMVTIPSFHHEAIASGMFFLMAGIYLFFLARSRSYCLDSMTAVLLALSLGASLGSRFSYLLSVGFLVFVYCWGAAVEWKSTRDPRSIRSAVIVSTLTAACVGLLLEYNYLRYGSFLESGMTYQASYFFGEYFRTGNYFRYDHLPYNLWSFFYRVPELTFGFPFLKLPAYLLKVESVEFSPYRLLNLNELTVSIFFLMPALLLLFFPFGSRVLGTFAMNRSSLAPDRMNRRAAMEGKTDAGSNSPDPDRPVRSGVEQRQPCQTRGAYGLLAVVCALQVFPVALTVGTTARYYYDFAPIMLLMAFLGALSMRRAVRAATAIVVLLAALSLLLGLSLPVHGIAFYKKFLFFESPLTPWFFGGRP